LAERFPKLEAALEKGVRERLRGERSKITEASDASHVN
jgi:hypothetical protein